MADILFSLPAFIFVLGVIIFVHEAGHLFVAKAFGMRVFIFSFGFGKRLFGFQWGDTDCRVSLVPLGGYVKLEGEPEDHLSEDTSQREVGDGKDFLSRPRWQRFVVYLAGPAMNVVLTMVVLTIFYMIGFMVEASRYDRPLLGVIEPGSPAAAAGLQPGDLIVAIDGRPVKTWEEVQYEVLPRPDRDLVLTVRGATEREVTVRPLAKGQDKVGDIGAYPLVRISAVSEGSPAQRAGFRPDDAILRIGDTPVKAFEEIPPLVQASKGQELAILVWRDGQSVALAVAPALDGGVYRIGVGPKLIVQRFPFPGAVREAAAWSWNTTKQTLGMLKGLATGRVSPKAALMGPVGIARVSGERAREGIGPLFSLIAVLSLSVGILNLVPLAPLDGGHMAILASEGLIRRDFSLAVKTWIMNAGALVIFLLIGLVLYSDLSKTSLLGKYLP
ncbi:MAG TPA: RIP metalloprotease RseP [Vicinamibacteria bacterium]